MENSTDIVKVNGESTGGVTTFDYGMRMASLTPEERTQLQKRLIQMMSILFFVMEMKFLQLLHKMVILFLQL